MLTKALAVFLLSALAAAQYGFAPPPVTTAPTSNMVAPTAPADTPGHMNIDVAFQGTLAFKPSSINAPVGTLVTFWFPNSGLDHSVTQSSFQNPCTYLQANASTGGPAGFDSSLLSSSNFTINITDTNPIWYFCKQTAHCGQGMVGSINAPGTGDTYDTFRNAALAIGINEPVTPENGPVLAGVNSNATGPPVPDLPSLSQPSVPVLPTSVQPSIPVLSASAQSSSLALPSLPAPSISAPASTSSNDAMKVTTSIGFSLFAVALGVAMA